MTSTVYYVTTIYIQALDKAKESARKERMLCKQREQAQMTEQINLDLTYCVRSLRIFFFQSTSCASVHSLVLHLHSLVNGSRSKISGALTIGRVSNLAHVHL